MTGHEPGQQLMLESQSLNHDNERIPSLYLAFCHQSHLDGFHPRPLVIHCICTIGAMAYGLMCDEGTKPFLQPWLYVEA